MPADAAVSEVNDRVLLECRDVSKTYSVRGRDVQAVHSVNLTVHRGETLLIQGHSGAGKSTLLGLLGALEMPSTGTITVEGAPVERMPRAELLAWRRRVGFIFQDHNLLLGWTAEENVTAALLGMDLSRSQQQERARQLLDRFGLGDRLDHLPGELSRGERQRVAVARALVREPAFILADEPTGDVDEDSAQLIIQQLLEAARRTDVALIVATHGLMRPEFSGRLYRMHSGALSADGPVS